MKEIIGAIKTFRLETWQDLAALSQFIKQKEKETDLAFDYRYSILIISFANFIHQGLLTIEDLEGLNQDKIAKIKEILKS